MKNQKNSAGEISQLRQQAEMQLKSTVPVPPLSEADTQKLFHELQVHQIELEMQNEQLQESISATEDTINLYDFAPVGYFTLSRTGKIVRLNFNGAQKLGKDRSHLINSNFRIFLSNDSQPAFNLFLGNVFQSKVKESCELILSVDGREPMHVQLNGIATESGEQCLLTAIDITDRKLTEKFLRNSQALLKSSLESQKDTILLSIDRDYRYLYFNQAHSDSMKSAYNMDVQLGMNILEYITSEDDREIAKENYDRALSGESHSNIRKYGEFEFAWYESFFNPIVNEKNEIIGATGLARNITDRKHSEGALQESEVRFRKLLQNVQSVSVQGYAPDGTTQYWNLASEQLYGYTAKEAIGKNLVDLIIPPEMRVNVKQAILQMAETGQPIASSELSLMRKDGSLVSVFSSHTIIQVPGQPQELFCIDIDLTERKKAEQELKDSEIKYRELIENLPDAIGIYVEGKIVLVNKECLKLLAAASADELIGKPVTQFVHPDYRVIVQKRMQKAAHEGIVLPLTEEKFIRLDGSFVDVEVKAMSIQFGNQSGVQLIVRDITERKEAEKIRKESEEKYRFMFANNPQPMWIFDVETLAFLEVNQAAVIHYGYSEDEFLTMTLKDIRPAEDIPKLLKGIESPNPEYNQPGEFKHIKKNGEIIDVQITRHNVTFNGRKARHVLINDVTERNRVEDAQRQSQVFLNSIIENSPNMLWISDENGTLIRMNQACRDQLHLKDEEVVGIYNILNDNLIKEQGLLPLVKDVFEKGATVRFEISYNTGFVKSVILEKTTQIFLDVNISPILNLQGKVINAIIQEIDITERKLTEDALLKSKHQYDDLVSKIPVGVYILRSKSDGEFALDYVSPRMAEMLGLSAESLLADKESIFKAIHPDDVDGFRTLSRDGIHQHRPFNWKGRIVADGNIKWMHFRSTPEPLENGDTLWHGLIVDITERVNAEQEISLKNKELSDLVAEKDKFFSLLAHDLRSPFNSILGFTQMLDEDLPTMEFDQIKHIASVLRNSAFSAYSLLENLLEWSRMKRGMTSYNPETFKLRSKIEESLKSVIELSRKKWIEISVDVPVDLQVLADQNMLGSIIRNLASNAIKFTPKYGTVLVSAQINDDQNIEISVKDSGIGMNQNILNKLFSNDEHTNRKGTEGEASSGLGLIICKEFVEKHGGRIWAESEVGRGSTFYFTLPQYMKV